jgi:hypothetical protein
MRRNTGKLFHCCVILIFLNQILYSQVPDSSKNSLENQQVYIRGLVDQQKKQVLNNHPFSDSTEKALNDYKMAQLLAMDSILLKQMKTMQMRDNTDIALKKATSEFEPRKSNVKKAMLIGGLSGGAVVGALAYFLSSGGSKSNGPTDSYINDKPPVHP